MRLQADIKQTLDLLLAPRLLQMLKVLSLPYLEMVDQICTEAEENPVFEVERRDEYVEFLRYLTSDRKIKKEADFEELPGLENFGRVEKTLEEHLFEQLEFEDIDETYKEIGKEIIGNIDDQGYLLAYPELRERIMAKFKLSRPTVDKVLKIIQSFEPDGVGARDLKECLLIQIEGYNFESDELQAVLKRAIKDHLTAISAGDHAQVAAALGLPENGVREIADFIKKNLNPYPGADYGGQARQVIPSFAVEKGDKGYFMINLETRYGPVIRLSADYLKMMEDPKTDAKTVEFLKEKVKRAKELLEDFSKRSETLEKIVRKIIDSQRDFLDRGVTWLAPLPQKRLADEFGLHPSTISRAVAEKYIQTPQGLYPLKFLCPRGPKGMTAARTKALIAEIIRGEDQSAPLTDEQITERLRQSGSRIERRTVAYYRGELKLPTATERAKR